MTIILNIKTTEANPLYLVLISTKNANTTADRTTYFEANQYHLMWRLKFWLFYLITEWQTNVQQIFLRHKIEENKLFYWKLTL